MEIKEFIINNEKIVELKSDLILFSSIEEAKQILIDLYYQGFDEIIIHEKNIIKDFFDLKNGMAGEILQSFSNFRMRLTIVGNFKKFENKALQAFIMESNKGILINFRNES